MKIGFWRTGSLCLVAIFLVIGWNALCWYMHWGTISAFSHTDLIRFHVLANSDSEADQQVKLKVRDAVIAYLSPYLSTVTDIGEARSVVEEQRGKIQEIAETVIAENGFCYPVTVQTGVFAFPVKVYGDFALPAGKYEAVRILIGNAEGKNWWCIVFPPLCFIDITNAAAILPERGESQALVAADDNDKIVFKSKIMELLQNAAR